MTPLIVWSPLGQESRWKHRPNNYFYIRVYSTDGAKLELYRDKKQPSTHREIIDGLKRAIELIEKLEAVSAKESIR